MQNVNNNKRKIEEPPATSSKKIRRIAPIKISDTDLIATKFNASTLNASQELLVPLEKSEASISGETSGKTIEYIANINPAFLQASIRA